jgi:hypothetical protein
MSDSSESRELSGSLQSADETFHVSCDFCGRSQELYAAIEAGWIPGYVEFGDEDALENDCRVCPECIAKHLRYDEQDGAFWQVDPPNA